jgi:hypothetical protein
MSSHVDDALEWLGRAEQAREVAGLLSDPGAKEAVLQLAESYERLASGPPWHKRELQAGGELASFFN